MHQSVSTNRHVGFVRVIIEDIMRNKYHKGSRQIAHAPFRGEGMGERGMGERGMTPLDGRSRRLRRRSSSRSRLVEYLSKCDTSQKAVTLTSTPVV